VKLLIVGREGQVARALARGAASQGLDAIAIGRPQLDLEKPETIAPIVAASAPDIVINAAAFTAVDQAESEHDRAFAINARGAEVVALAAAQVGAPILHVSTDYVFEGDKNAPYVEDDAAAPKSVYGASKFEGEQRVRAANISAVIIRTAWIHDSQGRNFVRTMLRLARTRTEIPVVEGQLGCPTYAADLAEALLAIAGQKAARPGIYHCAGTGETTWAGLAEEVFALSRSRAGPSARVIPIPSDGNPTLAPRPANSRLDCSKLAEEYGVRMRPWREALVDCVDAIAASGWRVE